MKEENNIRWKFFCLNKFLNFQNEQVASAIGYSAPLFSSEKVDDSMKQKYLEEEKERLRMFEVDVDFYC